MKRPSKLHCDPIWCGRGCTEAEYTAAVRKAAALAHELVKHFGPGWEPSVWDNLGWRFRALSPCRRITVGYNGRRSYMALMGESASGRWVAHAETAPAAVRKVIRLAKQELRELTELLTGL